jgi:hypothetical protein
MKIFFNGTVEAFATLCAKLVMQGVHFETKWYCEDDGSCGQAEIIFTGAY